MAQDPEPVISNDPTDHPAKVLWRDVFTPDWSQFHPLATLLLVPVIALALFASIAIGNFLAGVMIAAGAFTVGFGSFQQIGASRTRPMLLATGSVCVASWIGTVAGLTTLTAIIACAAAGCVYGLLSRRGPAAMWVGLQCAIWLVISTAYPAWGLDALKRGALILMGGLLQTAVFAVWWRIGCTRRATDAASECFPHSKQAQGPQAISVARAAVTVGIAAILYRWISAQNAYWIPMTTLIVIRPALNQTVKRGIARVAGTLVGVYFASLLVRASSNRWFLAAGVVLFTWAAYTLLNVNYAYFAVFLSAYVVFLLSIVGLSPGALAERRAAFTAIGGGIAFLTHLIWARKARVAALLPRFAR